MQQHRGDTTGNTLIAIVAILAIVLLAAAAFRIIQQRQNDDGILPDVNVNTGGGGNNAPSY